MGPYLELEFARAGRLDAAADAYVRGGDYADDNFGSEDSLILKDGPNESFKRETYVSFDTSMLDGATVSLALVYMHGRATGGTDADVMMYTIGGSGWGETTITWNNKPVADEYIGTFTVDDTLEWKAFDITPYIQQTGGAVDLLDHFVLKSADDRYLKFDSRETLNTPYLYIELE